MSEQKIPEANDLLKECNAMPALIQNKVGKLFDEQAKYFMPAETLFAQIKKSVQELVNMYETSGEQKAEGNATILKMNAEQKEKVAKGVLAEPRMVPLEEMIGENSIPYAIQWVTSTMVFIESTKKGFDTAKQNFNSAFEDVKKEGELSTAHILLRTLDQLQHPEKQKNPNFHNDLRKGGIERFMHTIETNANFLNLAQSVYDEHLGNVNAEFERCAIINNVVDNTYAVITKIYSHVMQNVSDDLQNETDSKAKSEMQMKIVLVYVQQKNILESFRSHLHRLNALSLELLHIRSMQQNILLRCHTLYVLLIKNIFEQKP